jgi:serine/threonine protein phosphatase PrpC
MQPTKPSFSDRPNRIEAAGATVTRGRIGGRLAMSRCIGDHSFKCNPDRAIEEQAVSCVPDVSVFCRKEDEDEFLLLACDGVFDVMSNDEICYTVRRSIHDWQKCNGGGVQSVMTGAEWGRTAEHLIDVCFSKQSRDNMSVILVAFPASWTKGGDVHPSAQYLMTWSCKDVQKWLACNNFTEYQEVSWSRSKMHSLPRKSCYNSDGAPEMASRILESLR